MTRIIYSCDVHGSEEVWLKFLGAAENFHADVILMNGDLTGKVLVPICKMKDGTWKTPHVFGRDWTLKTEEEVKEFERKVYYGGMYPLHGTYEEVMELAKNREKWMEIFDKAMVEGIRRWLKMAVEKVNPKVKIIVNPGNDDSFSIDEVIKGFEKEYENIIYPLDKVVYLDEDHPVISCEWVNPTPFDSPREESEEKLQERLDKLFEKVDDYTNLVCNFHCPPFDSTIDSAPKLDKNLKPILTGGHPILVPVGGKAVRRAIEKYQPLLGLHGHIHESSGEVKIGRTICVNPGSEYLEGILHIYVVDLCPSGIEKYWRAHG